MIKPDNVPVFKTDTNQTTINDLKHQFYYQLNRQLKNLHPTTKYLEIGFKNESILHLVNKELNEAGYYSLLFIEEVNKVNTVKLRLLIKD